MCPLYVVGLIGPGDRKSVQPMAAERFPRSAAQMADVIVIGAGATGITAAIAAREAGASVTVLDVERHIGGHAICSGGNLSFGGGKSYQKKYGVEDSPDVSSVTSQIGP